MDRKKFLKNLPVLGAACGLSISGCSTGTGTDSNDLTGDLAIVTQAAEREAVAVQTYTAAAESGIITTQTVLDTAVYYRSHHMEHLALFNELVRDLGGNEVNLENASADGRVGNVTSEEDAILLAMSLELDAAQAYLHDAVTNLRGNQAKLVMGGIYPVELAHFVTLKTALGQNPNITGATFVEISSEFTRFS